MSVSKYMVEIRFELVVKIVEREEVQIPVIKFEF